MRNYFKLKRTPRKSNEEFDRRINRAVVLNVLLACMFWLLSVIIAGINEYVNSAWTMIGLFLPGLLFYSIRKSAKTLILVFLAMNVAGLFYPLLELILFFSAPKDMVIAQWIFALILLVAVFLFVKTTLGLFREALTLG